MWRLLAEPCSVEELAALLAEAYSVDAGELALQIAPAVGELAAHGALCRVP